MSIEDAPRRKGSRAEGPVATLALSAFGLGLFPYMPGTMGSLGTIIALGIFPSSRVAGLGLLILLFVYGVLATLRFAGLVAGPDGHGDPGWVVSDEVAGQSLACLPVILLGGGWLGLLAAFAFFRLFDILKPGPVGRAERLPGATGILLDDLVAGLLAALATWLLQLTGVLG
jgi:phosphatidylglycerophosphatase A